jgi:branched-chain amino acid transport system substrate-binding protein
MKIVPVVADSQCAADPAVNAANKVIDQDQVGYIIGEVCSSASIPISEIVNAKNVLQISPTSTNANVTLNTDGSVKPYTFRACFIDPFQGAGAATYAYRDLGLKKAALLIDVANDYSVGLASFFKKSFTKLGGEVVATLNYQSGDQDFTAQLQEIMSKQPDVLFIPSYFSEGAIIMKQVQELGGTFKIMGGDAMDNPEITAIGGSAVEGFMHTTFPYDPSMPDMNPVAQKFTDEWKKINPDSDPNVNAALGYDAYMIIMDAITRAGSAEPQAITDALAATKGFVGVTGTTTINETHDAEKPVGLVMIKDGKKTYIGAITPEL